MNQGIVCLTHALFLRFRRICCRYCLSRRRQLSDSSIAPVFKALGFGNRMSLVHGYRLLIQPNDVGQHRIFCHLARDLVYLHPPHVGGSAGYGQNIHDRFQLGVIDYHDD